MANHQHKCFLKEQVALTLKQAASHTCMHVKLHISPARQGNMLTRHNTHARSV